MLLFDKSSLPWPSHTDARKFGESTLVTRVSIQENSSGKSLTSEESDNFNTKEAQLWEVHEAVLIAWKRKRKETWQNRKIKEFQKINFMVMKAEFSMLSLKKELTMFTLLVVMELIEEFKSCANKWPEEV